MSSSLDAQTTSTTEERLPSSDQPCQRAPCDSMLSLVAGNNWLSIPTQPIDESYGLFSYSASGEATYMDDPEHPFALQAERIWASHAPQDQGIVDGKTWRIGFRCAYDGVP